MNVRVLLFTVAVGVCAAALLLRQSSPTMHDAASSAQGPVARAAGDAAYAVDFTIDFTAESGEPNAEIAVGRGAHRFRELRMNMDPDRFDSFSGDGEVSFDGAALTWRPPESGGTLRYRAHIENRRSDAGYDARMTDHGALFRGNDVFPTATTRVLRGSESVSRLRLILPDDWSAVTRYAESDDEENVFLVDNDGLNFSRPSGWMIVGDIGVRRDRIAGRRVAVAALAGEDFRRMDVMAFLNWTLPDLAALFPAMDERLLIVGAGDPMWRGGLSGPGSLFVHAGRPMISENGTSTFLHELVHVAMGVAGSDHDDWVVEGLAEFYSIELLRRSGTLSARRAEISFDDLRAWGQDVESLFVRSSSGPVTARAVTLLAALDAELNEATGGTAGIDAVVAELVAAGSDYRYATLCAAAAGILGEPASSLAPSRVPGAPDEAACTESR